MLAAKLFGTNDLRIVTCDKPEIRDDEILMKTSASAICGTDLRMIGNGYKGVDADHPLTLGHEISGVIDQVGTRVQGYIPGMKVAVAPNVGCGICDACVNGDTHLCATYSAFGINMDGGFAEYVRIPANAIVQGNVMILDPGLPLDVAAIFEPMSCVVNGQEQADVRLNDTVLIVGAGPIGLMHALLAKARGASLVYLRDLSRERMDQGVAIDGSIVPIYDDNLLDAIMSLTHGRGVDVCITACPSGAAQAESLELMAMNGRVLFFGGLPAGKDRVTLQTNLIHYRQLKISGSTRSNLRQYRSVARMVAAGNLDLGSLISHRYALAQFPEAVEFARSAQGLKTVIVFDQS